MNRVLGAGSYLASIFAGLALIVGVLAMPVGEVREDAFDPPIVILPGVDLCKSLPCYANCNQTKCAINPPCLLDLCDSGVGQICICKCQMNPLVVGFCICTCTL